MRKSVPAIPLVACCLILSWTQWASSPTTNAPGWNFLKPRMISAKFSEGRELTHTSIIKNTGDAPLHITGFGVGA